MDFNIHTALTIRDQEIKTLHEIMKKLRPPGDMYKSTKIGFTLNVQLSEDEINFVESFLQSFKEEV